MIVCQLFFNEAVFGDFQGGQVYQLQHLFRKSLAQEAASIFPVAVSMPEQLVMSSGDLAVIFLVCHGGILPFGGGSVKGYVVPGRI
jgi:hypothetical protein